MSPAASARAGRRAAQDDGGARWTFEKVKFPAPLTIEQNCRRCHGEKDASWIQEKLKAIKRRL